MTQLQFLIPSFAGKQVTIDSFQSFTFPLDRAKESCWKGMKGKRSVWGGGIL